MGTPSHPENFLRLASGLFPKDRGSFMVVGGRSPPTAEEDIEREDDSDKMTMMTAATTAGPFFRARETFPLPYCGQKPFYVSCDYRESSRKITVPRTDGSKLPEFSFNRPQLSDQDCQGLYRREFGRFIAREAVLDEEYWTAAWLRAEANWESLKFGRHPDSYKRKYAEQEFCALKRRCTAQDGNLLKCFCLIAVKKEDKNRRRNVISSVLGTLDVTIRQFMHGETYPGEVRRSSAVMASQKPFNAHKYAYIANVCVSKSARRQGIALNLLYLATDVATLEGMKQLFVHVNTENKPALELYEKHGFKVVEAASSVLSKDRKLLMSMELNS